MIGDIPLVEPENVEIIKSEDWRGGFLASFDKMQSESGISIRGGEVWVEHNPAFYPLQVFGLGEEPGLYDKYANHYLYAAIAARRGAQLSEFTLTVHPSKAPTGLDGDKRRMRERFYQHALKTLAYWEASPMLGGPHIVDIVTEIGLLSRQNGFYLGELIGKKLSNGWIIPGLPAYRSPSIIRGWVRQAGKIVGAILEASGEGDYGDYKTETVLVPWYKLLHVRNLPVGENPLGRSELRSVIGEIDKDTTIGRVEALGVSARARGQLFLEQESGFNVSSDPEEAKRMDAYLRNYAAGADVSGLRLPPGVRAKLLSPDSAMPNLVPIRQFYLSTLSLGLGSEGRAMSMNDVGSYNGRETAEEQAQSDVRYTLGVVCRGLEGAISRFAHLSGVGYGKLENAFAAHLEPVFENQGSRVARVRTFADLVKSGVLTATEEDERYIRETLRFPQRTGSQDDSTGSEPDANA